jgi:osmotically inducible lipoprotein OsmB
MTSKRIGAFVLAAALLSSVPGCSGEPLTTREKGTIIGGVAGAGGGAIIGSAVGAPGAGAAIGGAGGAVAGYAIGNHMQNEEDSDYYRR